MEYKSIKVGKVVLSVLFVLMIASSASGEDSTSPNKIELVNGDEVIIEDHSDKRGYTIVSGAESSASYSKITDNGHLYLIPNSINKSAYDRELFNTTRLVQIQSNGNDMSYIYEFRDEKQKFSVEDNKDIVSYSENVNLAYGSSSDLIETVNKIRPEKVWLDREVEFSLYDSTKEVMADTARGEYNINGSGVNVSVLDTGINSSHPDLQDSVILNKSFGTNTSLDMNGHGTHVAGIISSDASSSGGRVDGVAPGVNLFNMKVLDESGSGSVSDIIKAINASVSKGADVISMSLGFPGSVDNPLNSAVEDARNKGVIVVTSAGNSGPSKGSISSPGNSPASITVGSDDTLNRRYSEDIAPFSSRGPTSKGQIKPEVVAPGVGIKSTDSTSKGYKRLSGTSMSAPHVSGIVAILLDYGYNSSVIESKIVNTADRLGQNEEDTTVYDTGSGQVNTTAAVASRLSVTPSVADGFSFSRTEGYGESEKISISVKNGGNESVTIDRLNHNLTHVNGNNKANYTVQMEDSNISSGESTRIKITVTADRNKSGFYGGYISFDTESVSYTIPLGYVQPASKSELVRVKKIPYNGRDTSGERVAIMSADGSDVRVGLDSSLKLNNNGVAYFSPKSNSSYKLFSLKHFSYYSDVKPDAISVSNVSHNISNVDTIVLDERNWTSFNFDLSEISEDSGELTDVKIGGSVKSFSSGERRYSYSRGYLALGSAAESYSGELYVSGYDEVNPRYSVYKTISRTTQPENTRDKLPNWGIDNNKVYSLYSWSSNDTSNKDNTYSIDDFQRYNVSYYHNDPKTIYDTRDRSVYRNEIYHASQRVSNLFPVKTSVQFGLGDRKNQSIYYNKGIDNKAQMDFVGDYRGTNYDNIWYKIKSQESIDIQNPSKKSISFNEPLKTSTIQSQEINRLGVVQKGTFYMDSGDLRFYQYPEEYGSYKISVNGKQVTYSDTIGVNPNGYNAKYQSDSRLKHSDTVSIELKSKSLRPFSSPLTKYTVSVGDSDKVPRIRDVSIPSINQSNVGLQYSRVNGYIDTIGEDKVSVKYRYKIQGESVPWKNAYVESAESVYKFKMNLPHEKTLRDLELSLTAQNNIGNSVNIKYEDVASKWVSRNRAIGNIRVDNHRLPDSVSTQSNSSIDVDVSNKRGSKRVIRLNVSLTNGTSTLTKKKDVKIQRHQTKTVTFNNLISKIDYNDHYEIIVSDNRSNRLERDIDIVTPVSSSQPPNDLDRDGLLEDVDGNNKFNIFDVQAFFIHFESPSIQQNPDLYSFDGTGGVTILDVQSLFEKL